jgi:mono/diheme cytochrome c family protein
VSSRHFPDVNQGDFMACNTIGFLGISFGSKRDDGAGFVGKANGDLLSSSDGNFRPVDLEFAPDGSLYFLDWHNPLIGHMQHNARDPNRDHEHGRIYRVTYPERPLLKPAKIDGATVAELLENLKEPEYRTRYRTRRELRSHAPAEVLPAVKAWVAKLDPQDPAYEHHLCEALWATWAQNQPNPDLLRRLLQAKHFEARAAAVDVLRHAYRQIPDHVALLTQAVQDEHPRVRLTAIVAATWLDNADGARIALAAFRRPVDRWVGPVLHYALSYTLKDDVAALKAAGQLNLADNPAAEEYLAGKSKVGQPLADTTPKPARKLTAAEDKVFQLGREVYFRDAHCATCHQADGKGIANVYPPLAKSDWLQDDERFIKIVLKGLWGPITVNQQAFDPSKGVPPMMGFAGMLNDAEVAEVLSYVRLSFGNNGKLITAAQVAKVRAATQDRVNFYTTEEILKDHPLKPAEPAKGKK